MSEDSEEGTESPSPPPDPESEPLLDGQEIEKGYDPESDSDEPED